MNILLFNKDYSKTLVNYKVLKRHKKIQLLEILRITLSDSFLFFQHHVHVQSRLKTSFFWFLSTNALNKSSCCSMIVSHGSPCMVTLNQRKRSKWVLWSSNQFQTSFLPAISGNKLHEINYLHEKRTFILYLGCFFLFS